MARPRKTNRTLRDRVVGTRFTAEEQALLESVAGGQPLGTVVRELSLAAATGTKVPPPRTSVDGALRRRELNRIGTNLNGVARALHTIAAEPSTAGLEHTLEAFAATAEELRGLIVAETVRR